MDINYGDINSPAMHVSNNEENLDLMRNKFFARMISYLLCMIPFLYFVRLLPITYSDTFFSSIFFLFVFIKNNKYFKGKIKLDVYILYVTTFAFILLSGFDYERYLINWFGIVYIVLFSSMPWYIIGRLTDDYKLVIDYLKKYSFFITLICLAVFTHKFFQGSFNNDGDMYLSYSLLPAAIISTYAFMRDWSKLHLLNALVSFSLIIIVGSRGPILCYLVFGLLYLTTNFKQYYKLLFFLIISGIIMLLNFKAIVYSLILLLNKTGITSRTLYKLYDSTIFTLTGRDTLQEVSFELLMNNLFLGVGLGAERIGIYRQVYLPVGRTGKLSVSYPHNIFVELLTQYGLIIGTALIILIIYILLKSITKPKTIEQRDLIIIFIGIGLIELMISSSYLLSQHFFYLIGLGVGVIVKNKYENNTS